MQSREMAFQFTRLAGCEKINGFSGQGPAKETWVAAETCGKWHGGFGVRRSSPLWIFSFALRCSRKERSTAAIVAALDIFFRTALQPKRKIHSGDRRRFGYFLSHCVAAEKKDLGK